jgi:imidazolonepropionase-like amidohydrolase
LTSLNAKRLGVEDRIGTIAPGLVANLLILEGDPIADIKMRKDSENMHTVFKKGRIVAAKGNMIW